MILLAWLLAIAPLGCSDPEPIRIGFIGGLTGRTSDLGIAGRNGAQLAIEEFNQKGGLRGARVELVTRDDRQDADQARLAAQSLIAQRVVAVVGPMTSQVAMAILPQFEQAGILLLSPTVSTNELSGRDDQFLRIYPASRLAAGKLARHATHALGLKNIQVVYDTANLAHTESWFRAFAQSVTQAGCTISQTLTFRSGKATRFTDLADAISRGDGDGLFIIANAIDTAMLCRQLTNVRFGRPILVTEWSGTQDLLDYGRASVNGLQFLHTFDRDSRTLAYLSFRERFIDRFGTPPGFAAVHAYDAARILLDELCESRPAQLKQALLSRGSYVGLQGPISFDRYGDIDRDLFLVSVEDHRFRTLGRSVADSHAPSQTSLR